MAMSRLPAAPLRSATARRLAQAAAAAPRRAYWSARCGKARYGDRWPSQYWAGPHAHAGVLRSRARPLRAAADDAAHAPAGAAKPAAAAAERDVQAEELRFYDEFQRLVGAQWREHAALLQRAVERDPHAALFGLSERRGVWNPWRMRWPRWIRDAEQPESEAARDTPAATTEKHAANAAGSTGPVKTEPTTRNWSVEMEEVYIDPITLRKVVRKRSLPGAAEARKSGDAAVDIPVKPFKPSAGTEESGVPKRTSENRRPVAGFASQPWLQREGFAESGAKQNPTNFVPSSPAKAPSPAPKVIHMGAPTPLAAAAVKAAAVPARVETSLNRMSEKKDSPAGQPRVAPSMKPLAYNPVENQAEDIDLLRASDVRAAAGRSRSKQPHLSMQEVAARRQELYSTFIETQRKFEKQLKEELIAALKEQDAPTKSPLWSIWMLYDYEARKDWAKWSKERTFTLKGHQDFEQMQFMAKALISQMPAPADTFKSGGTSLGRFLDANRASLVLRDLKSFINAWHMEVQTILARRGARPLPEDVLDDVRKSLLKYHRELRQQILSGYGHANAPATKTSADFAKLFDNTPSAEMRGYREAMRRFEERSRSGSLSSSVGTGTAWTKWAPPAPASDAGEAKRLNENKSLYNAVKGVYEGNKEAFHPQPTSAQKTPKEGFVLEQGVLGAARSMPQDRRPELLIPTRHASVEESNNLEPMAAKNNTIQSAPAPGNPSHTSRPDIAAPTSADVSASEETLSPLQAMETVVLKLDRDDEDVRVHQLLAAKVDTALSDTRVLSTSENEGFQKVLEFMRQASTGSLLPVMRLDTALNAAGYRLANYGPELLVYQKPSASAPAGPLSAEDQLAELLTQAWPNLSGAPETVEAQVNARSGTSIDSFQLRGTPAPPPHATPASKPASSAQPTPSPPAPPTATHAAQPTHSATAAAAAAAREPVTVRREEPVFSGQSVRSHRRRHKHAHRHAAPFRAARWVRRLGRALARGAYTVGLFLLGAYMIGLGVEWGRYREDRRLAAERQAGRPGS